MQQAIDNIKAKKIDRYLHCCNSHPSNSAWSSEIKQKSKKMKEWDSASLWDKTKLFYTSILSSESGTNSDLSISCSIFRRNFYCKSQEKRSFMYSMFFKSTLRLKLWIRMGSTLFRNSITDLCSWHSAMSLDILAYLCFRRILSWYRRFWKSLKTKPKNSKELIPSTTPLCLLCLKALHSPLQTDSMSSERI